MSLSSLTEFYSCSASTTNSASGYLTPESDGFPSSDSAASSSLPTPTPSTDSLTLQAEALFQDRFLQSKVRTIIREHDLDESPKLFQNLKKALRCIEQYKKCTLDTPVMETFGEVELFGIGSCFALMVDEEWIDTLDPSEDSRHVQAKFLLECLPLEERRKANVSQIKNLLIDSEAKRRTNYSNLTVDYSYNHSLGGGVAVDIAIYANDDIVWIINGKEIDIQYPLLESKAVIIKRQSKKYSKSAEQISRKEIAEICKYVEKNESSLLEQAKETGKSIYLRPSVTRLARALMFTPEGQVFMLLNQTRILDKLLGKGAFKKVTVGIEVNTGKLYASYTPVNAKDEKNKRMFAKDVQNLEMMTEEDWPDYFPKIIAKAEYPTKDGNHTKTRVIVELLEKGELYHYYKELSSDEKRIVFESLIHALAFMHRKGFLHRDIKPENVLLGTCEKTQQLKVVLSDSMLCRMDDKEALKLSCGSHSYVPLELIQAINEWHRKAAIIQSLGAPKEQEESALAALCELFIETNKPPRDVWSLGCTLAGTLLQIIPNAWDATHEGEMSDLQYALDQIYGRPYSPKWLIKRMLELDPNKRISAIAAEDLLPKIAWRSGI